jgi:hypothetical protein
MEIQKKNQGGTNGENDEPAFNRCPSPRFHCFSTTKGRYLFRPSQALHFLTNAYNNMSSTQEAHGFWENSTFYPCGRIQNRWTEYRFLIG